MPWTDPLSAYAGLRAAGRSPVLLLGAGAHPGARWSFLAFDPVRELEVRGEFVEETHEGGTTATAGNVLGHLRASLAEVRLPFGSRPPVPFSGGWVGFFGYEFARHLDPAFPAPSNSRRPPTPDAFLLLSTGVMAFDHHANQASLWSTDLEGDRKSAQKRLASASVQVALPRPPATPPTSANVAWNADPTQDQFMVAVAALQERIRDGDLFQANLATRFSGPCNEDPLAILDRLRAANPSPFMALLERDGFSLVSGSPELLLGLEGDVLRSRPIAGTRRRGTTAADDEAMERELLEDPKEQAEHTMLVDLVRNDLARTCVAGTIRVPERMSVERYRHVMHLASSVEGRLRPGLTFLDAFQALFPGGTITGAPKLRACQRIHESETVARGAYTGSVGYVGWDGDAQWNILIRTLVLDHDLATGSSTAHVHAGSGIVEGSDAEREWKEARRKARALMEAASGAVTGGNPSRLGEVVRHGSWAPAHPPRAPPGRRVLLVDNEDSFVHNLADYCAMLGAVTRVVRNDADLEAEVASFRPTHLILSPGPGWPADAGSTPGAARRWHGRIPILGVCLGHQAIGEAHGGRILRHPAGPVHGRTTQVLHDGAGLFAGLPSPLGATRYHSLTVDASGLGKDWRVDARLADGTVMAIRHGTHPTFGLQFHPESLCTERGLELILRFLESTA